MNRHLLLLAALVVVPVRAADKPLFLTGGPKAEDALRRFVERDPRLKARLEEAARREEEALAAARDPDLRDSVSDAGSGGREQLLRRLPGLEAPPAPTCRSLAECPQPDLAADVSDPALLPETLRRLVRPWMLLQAARGSEVELTTVEGPGDAALRVALKGLQSAPLTLNVTPRAAGGFEVWFDRPVEIASLYARERQAALVTSR